MEFFEEIAIDAPQAEAIARGLYAVAAADGVHEREAALIASFYGEAGGTPRALAELERRELISASELAAALHTDKQRRLFVKTAFLLALADGAISAAERQRIGAFAAALGVAGEPLAQLEQSVKEYLLAQLSH